MSDKTVLPCNRPATFGIRINDPRIKVEYIMYLKLTALICIKFFTHTHN